MATPGGPPGGLDWRPASSGNSVSWDGSAVAKRHRRDADLARERFVIESLEGLPVPRILEDAAPGTLRLNFVAGVSGNEAIEAGLAGDVLYALGDFLSGLHRVDTAQYSGELYGVGEVLVHGDFAHYNGLFDSNSGNLTAVLDWEAAYVGDKVTGLAWCEFQFRCRFPQEAWAVRKLFEGYGSEPDIALRELAVQRRVEFLTSVEESAHEPLHAITFGDQTEASCFVAALSRFLSSPDGNSEPMCVASQIWVDTPRTVLLNAQALRAASSRFGPLPANSVPRLPSTARWVVAGQYAGAIGVEEAKLFFEKQ